MRRSLEFLQRLLQIAVLAQCLAALHVHGGSLETEALKRGTITEVGWLPVICRLKGVVSLQVILSRFRLLTFFV